MSTHTTSVFFFFVFFFCFFVCVFFLRKLSQNYQQIILLKKSSGVKISLYEVKGIIMSESINFVKCFHTLMLKLGEVGFVNSNELFEVRNE